MNILIDLQQQPQTALQRLQSIQHEQQDFNFTIINNGKTTRITIQAHSPRLVQRPPPPQPLQVR